MSPVPFFNLNMAVDLYSGPKLQTRAMEKHPLRLPPLPQGNVWQSPTPATG